METRAEPPRTGGRRTSAASRFSFLRRVRRLPSVLSVSSAANRRRLRHRVHRGLRAGSRPTQSVLLEVEVEDVLSFGALRLELQLVEPLDVVDRRAGLD